MPYHKKKDYFHTLKRNFKINFIIVFFNVMIIEN